MPLASLPDPLPACVDGPQPPAASGSVRAVALQVLAPARTTLQPITVGLPFPRGSLHDPRCLRLSETAGSPVPLQTEPLAHWPDGSVKWLLLDFLLRDVPAGRHLWALAAGADRPPSPPRLTVAQTEGAIVVDTGAGLFEVDRRLLRPLTGVAGPNFSLPGPLTQLKLAGRGSLRRGKPPASARIESAVVEQRGPVRATVCLRGCWDGRPECRFVARLCFFAGTALVRLRLTLHNPERARHKGGLWDQGDPWSVYFDSLSLRLALRERGQPRVLWKAEPDQPAAAMPGGTLSLLQASSGGDNWQSRVHVNHEGRVVLPFRGYRSQTAGGLVSGLRASPIVSLRGDQAALTVAVPEFWQQFPKGLGVAKGELSVDLFAPQPGQRHELQGGEQKTHTLWLHFGPATEEESLSLEWAHRPALARAEPSWYADSGAVFLLDTPDSDRAPTSFDTLLEEALTGPNSFFAKREQIDEYGWRHFGETYADHENEHYAGPKPVVSHYNNQYDLVNGLLLQYLRSGDPRWWQLADPLARHVIDIDIYHTDRDRPAYSGGMFWHTDHYRDAATVGHRAYSRANRPPGKPYGGGPGNEHNWGTGLLHYYYLTGDPLAREAVLGLAGWVVRLDDGSLRLLGLIDDGPTGLASRTGGDLFHGPGRGGGNSINALLDGWLLTGAQSWLDKAEELIRRCIHPRDDLAAMDLTNPEHRWSYTVFLSVLARYLDLKAEAGQMDEAFAWARAVLRHYGAWLVEHERPYFDQVERLDFPNETWAAQEMRKANVLRLAARSADAPLRERLRQRGDELADRAWHDVFRFPTRTSTRSLAILLTEGARDACLRAEADEAVGPAGPPAAFGPPQRFVPQRQRVRQQLRTAGGLLRALLRAADPRRWPRALRARQL
jgi:hypothetical protein